MSAEYSNEKALSSKQPEDYYVSYLHPRGRRACSWSRRPGSRRRRPSSNPAPCRAMPPSSTTATGPPRFPGPERDGDIQHQPHGVQRHRAERHAELHADRRHPAPAAHSHDAEPHRRGSRQPYDHRPRRSEQRPDHLHGHEKPDLRRCDLDRRFQPLGDQQHRRDHDLRVGDHMPFTNGVATVPSGRNGVMTLYKAEPATITVNDGTRLRPGHEAARTFTGSATVTIPAEASTSSRGGDGTVAGELTFTSRSGNWTTDTRRRRRTSPPPPRPASARLDFEAALRCSWRLPRTGARPTMDSRKGSRIKTSETLVRLQDPYRAPIPSEACR